MDGVVVTTCLRFVIKNAVHSISDRNVFLNVLLFVLGGDVCK